MQLARFGTDGCGYGRPVTLGPGQLLRLTAAKSVANTALRWIPFFLFVLEDAFDAKTTTLTLIIGLGEMAGLGTLLIGGQLDRGKERVFLIAAMVLVSGSGIIALGGTVATFAVSFLCVIGATSLVTVAGHTWISRRVDFARRGRAIGTYEISWALALLIGAPIIALTIDVFGWRGPFVLIAIGGAVMAVIISQLPDEPLDAAELAVAAGDGQGKRRLPTKALVLIAASAAIATAGLSTIVIVGTWLEDAFGVSTGEVGLTAMAFGLAEITASGGSARFSDRLGKARTTAAALVAVVIGLIVMATASASFAVAVVGLALFFIGFEYAIVTSFSIVSEAAPLARGRALATSNAMGTLSRGGGTIASGFLYDAHGVVGPAVLSGSCAVLALTLLAIGGRDVD